MWSSINDSMSEWCSSPFWDTNLTWNNPDPDFTPCFEKTVLAWLPCLFLVLFTPLEIYFQLRTNSPRIPFNRYNVFKLIIIALAGITNLIDIANHQFSDDEKHSSVDFYTPVITFLTSILFYGLTHSSIRSGVRSSGTLFLFTALAVVCGAPQMRTELKEVIFNGTHEMSRHKIVQFTSYAVHYLARIIVFVLNCYADYYPVSLANSENLCPEKDSSFLSKFVFWWFNDLAWRGYWKPLNNDDLWEMNDDLRTKNVGRKFEFYWRRARDRLAQTRVQRARDSDRETFIDNEFGRGSSDSGERKEASIVFPLCQTFGLQYLHAAMFRLVFSSLLCVSPLILNLILAFVKEEHEYEWRGYLFAVLLLMVAVTRTLFLNQYFHRTFRLGVFMRTALASVIYKKALCISSGARKNYSIGEINNLMAVDANRFINSMMYISMLWAAPLEVGVAVYLLYNILGVSVFAGLASLAIVTPLSAYTAAKSEKLQKTRMEIKDKRVKLITEILSGIKVLKLYAWEPYFGNRVMRIRDSEIQTMRVLSFWEAASQFLWVLSPILMCTISFAWYVLTSNERVLDVRTAFVSFAIFNAIRVPLNQLPSTIGDLTQTWVSVKRINKFLNAEELDPAATSHEPRSEPIIIQNGRFSWEGRDGPPTLSNINMNVKAGHLIAVVGAVGAGKSSLLCAILGEMYKQWGSVNTTGTLAYIPQQAWVRNATFKANITFGARQKSRKFYERILEACALKADLATLPGGDLAEIGEKGVNLSGGQKQRLSLARAIYSEADTCLLDDPLSAVDANVGKHIFERVIGPKGMLRKKTRILVTHNISYLPQMDTIIVLKDGTISESGTYETLLEKQGDFANFLATFGTEERTTNEVDDEEVDDNQPAVSVDELRLSLNSIRSDEGSEAVVKVDGQRLIDEEEAEIGNVKFAVYKYYLKAMGLFRVAATILWNMIFITFTIGSGLWLSQWSTHPAVHSQCFYIEIYALLGFCQAFSVFAQVTFLFLSLLKGAERVHNYVLWAVLHWPALTFDRIPSGRILNRFSADVEILDSTLKSNMQPSLWLTAQVMSTLFVISYTTPKFLIVLVVLAVFYYLFRRFFIASARQLRRIESVSKSPIFSHFEETVVGAQSVRAYKLQTEFIQDFEMKVDNNMKSGYMGLVCNRWLSVRLETLGSLITFSATLFAVLGRNTLSAGLVGLSITYAIQVTNNLYQWVRMTADVETDTVAIERIKTYVDMEQEKPWKTPEDDRITEAWPSRGEIVFSQLHVRYQECLEPVLKGISFRVKSGEKVGIVGRTGAGKSSLTLCVFRIIESSGGEITIDDIDVAKLGLHTLRNRLTIIPQDPILFTGTLRMNLDPTETLSDESLWNALDMVDLKKYLMSSNMGLDYWITEGGSNFSVGQRQLICLGRALLRKSKVLVLDEATAAIDMETDALIQITIRNEFKDSTVLTVAHRLNTVMDYDRILVLDTGSVIEYDSPKNLLDNRESVFSKMALDAGLIASDAPIQ